MITRPSPRSLSQPRWRPAGSERLARLAGAHRFWIWTGFAVALALALRAPWFGAPLGNDEGGLTYIAGHWQTGGPNLYGATFLDRPPLLVGVFRLAAETGGAASVRVIGAVSAGMLVATVALIAREVRGSRSGIWAGSIAAVLVSSPALGSVLTPAELIAALPSALSVLMLFKGAGRERGGVRWFVAAGFLAIAALLVKQSFGDALVAGAVFLTVGAARASDRQRWARLAGAYLGGVVSALLCLEMLDLALRAGDGSMSYALIGFRVDGLSALAGSAGGLSGRLSARLIQPFVGSGLALALFVGAVGLFRLRDRRVAQAALGAWALGGLAGVLLGGSYWPHYLIELVPVAAVTASIPLASARRWGVGMAAIVLTLVAAGGVSVGSIIGGGAEVKARSVGESVGARSDPGDTIYVRYSQPNVTYYSGLRNPYPYEWSLMLRTFTDAPTQLQGLLRSDHRPTWVVDWESDSAYGMDSSGVTASLLREHYRPVSGVCGVPVLLERGLDRPGPGPAPGGCG